MMMDKKIGIILIAVLLLAACNEEEDPNAELRERLDNQIEEIETYLSENNINAFDTNGYYLEVLTENPSGEEPSTDDILAVYYQIQTLDGDPVAAVSAATGDDPDIIPFNEQRIVLPLGLYDLLSDMRTGEEVRVYLPFNRAYINYEIPGIIPAYSAIILDIELNAILSPEEVKQMQDARIKAYLADNNLLPADSLEGGVYYHSLEEGQSPEVKPGSNLQVRYIGQMLGGYVFDSNVSNPTPLSVNSIGNGSFVSGFETALLAMSEGEEGVTVFPSDQGYGSNLFAMPDTVSNDLQSRGYGVGNLRFFGAFKPIRFDLEVESVD